MKINLQAGHSQLITKVCNNVRVMSALSPLKFEFRGSDWAEKVELSAGMQFRSGSRTVKEVEILSLVNDLIDVQFQIGSIDDNRLSLDAPVRIDNASQFVDLGGLIFTGTTVSVPSNSQRLKLMIYASSSNSSSSPVWVGSQVGSGVPLFPDDYLELAVSEGVNFFCSSVGSEIFLSEIVRV